MHFSNFRKCHCLLSQVCFHSTSLIFSGNLLLLITSQPHMILLHLTSRLKLLLSLLPPIPEKKKKERRKVDIDGICGGWEGKDHLSEMFEPVRRNINLKRQVWELKVNFLPRHTSIFRLFFALVVFFLAEISDVTCDRQRAWVIVGHGGQTAPAVTTILRRWPLGERGQRCTRQPSPYRHRSGTVLINEVLNVSPKKSKKAFSWTW